MPNECPNPNAQGLGKHYLPRLHFSAARVQADRERFDQVRSGRRPRHVQVNCYSLYGYIPCPNHRLAPDAKWENVQYYCDRMRKVFG